MKTGCNKVIVVDDNKAEAYLTRIVYEEQTVPIEIIHCFNGQEFIHLLEVVPSEEIC